MTNNNETDQSSFHYDQKLLEKLIILTAPIVIVSTDINGVVRFINPAVQKVFGYFEGELLDKNLLNLLPELEQIEYCEFTQKTDRGELESFDDEPSEIEETTPTNKLNEFNYLEKFVYGIVKEGNKGELNTKNRHGVSLCVDVSINKISVANDVMYSVLINDITKIKKSEEELRKINEHLEELVIQRTVEVQRKSHDIQSILQNLPQGILTITKDGTVHNEYSAFLENILETQDIAQQNIMNLLFTDTNLGADILSQIDSTIVASLGEDSLQFEFNEHQLITEFEKKFPDNRKKSLELSWSAIMDQDDCVEKILLSIKDITEIKFLQAEASKQKKELDIIGQILSLPHDRFLDFINNSNDFLAENIALIKKTITKDIENLNLLFRNMHTIKGNARTYGFLHLTDLVHITEQEYTDLLNIPDKKWDQKLLLEQLQQVKEMLNEYAWINEHKLGRKGSGDLSTAIQYLTIEKDKISNLINSLKCVDRNKPEKLLDVLSEVNNVLMYLDTNTLEQIISDIVSSLPSLAKELGKEEPQVLIQDNNIVLKKECFNVIKNTFMHLLRNSLDHGLEPAEIRKENGKSANGKINITLKLTQKKLNIHYQDDGKGIDLNKIKEKALSKKLITPNQEITPEVISSFIFSAGISTANKITNVSGRGIGLDAVKKYYKKEGGSVNIKLLDSIRSTNVFIPFEFILTLPAEYALEKK